MSVTIDRPAPSVAVPSAPPERGARLRRRAAAGSFLGAAAITMAGILTTPFEGKAGEEVYLRTLAAHPKQAVLAATLLHFGYLLFVPAAFVMARLARRGAPKLSGVGLVLVVLGSGLSGLLVTDVYDLSIARHVGATAGAPISNMKDVPGVGLALVSMAALTSLGMILGLVLLAGALRRARLVPMWPSIALLVGFVSAFGAHDMLRTSAGFAAVCVALAYLGLRVLWLGDDRFERGSDARS